MVLLLAALKPHLHNHVYWSLILSQQLNPAVLDFGFVTIQTVVPYSRQCIKGNIVPSDGFSFDLCFRGVPKPLMERIIAILIHPGEM
ncbi:uncharacterized protein FOMMEDRAFT_21088 [Fomitiporia mediterranea MF3/22]|uniref:uncharacterized protein n=1 Tax=Fomitiporia mediterranea (strain MF3/22) TaxID=694068 RepID=UPI000440972A|nr:uncharacterized protein FOMMEDRAFT_21088 [Fomitiporia mediterranea MF3/22]EJD02350.1 hypothetical protein FOMMEDRAFT_21088 [Fomitiporia mediterranea MF3/22]